MGRIAVIGTLDTKETEAFFLKDRLASFGHEGLVFNASLKNFTPKKDADISQKEILSTVNALPNDLEGKDRDKASKLVEKGLGKKLREMEENGDIHGAIGYGGSVGSRLIIGGLTYLPTSFPKFIVTTVQNIVKEYVSKNIGIIPSPVDFINGDKLNILEKKVFSSAAYAIGGSVEEFRKIESENTIFITQMGTTTKCVTQCRDILDKHDFEVSTFHAAGPGGECFEELIERGVASGVIDITTTEISNNFVGGRANPYTKRLTSAIKKEIPMIISPGNVDTVVWDGPGTKKVPSKFRDREFHYHNPSVTLMRTSKEESKEIGKIFAQRMNKATSPIKLVLPERGWSEYDKKGGIKTVNYEGNKTGNEWFKPDYNKAFLKSIKNHIDDSNPNIEIISLDYHINDIEFSEKLCEYLMSIYNK